LLLVSTLCAAQAPHPEPVTDPETELSQAVYDQLKGKGEIAESSPLYDTLRPIAEAISKDAQPRYNHPFVAVCRIFRTQTPGKSPSFCRTIRQTGIG